MAFDVSQITQHNLQMFMDAGALLNFAERNKCKISRGTSACEYCEITNYAALQRIFPERLDSAGASLKADWLGKFEVAEFFELLSNSSLEFTSILMGGNIIN